MAIAAGLLAWLALAATAEARSADIQTTAPLADHSDGAIQAAVTQALRIAIRGAIAMGFSHVALRNAVVLEDAVAVQIVAADREPLALPNDEDEANDDDAHDDAEVSVDQQQL
jgi:hypothetical protein